MDIVYVLQHSYETAFGEEETKLIGVFSTKQAAKAAVNTLKSAPGFRDLPDHFSINKYSIDQAHWTEGFITKSYELLWSLWRQDDNGNVFMVSSGHTETEVLRLVREFEAKGHKQTYWAKENL